MFWFGLEHDKIIYFRYETTSIMSNYCFLLSSCNNQVQNRTKPIIFKCNHNLIRILIVLIAEVDQIVTVNFLLKKVMDLGRHPKKE